MRGWGSPVAILDTNPAGDFGFMTLIQSSQGPALLPRSRSVENNPRPVASLLERASADTRRPCGRGRECRAALQQVAKLKLADCRTQQSNRESSNFLHPSCIQLAALEPAPRSIARAGGSHGLPIAESWCAIDEPRGSRPCHPALASKSYRPPRLLRFWHTSAPKLNRCCKRVYKTEFF